MQKRLKLRKASPMVGRVKLSVENLINLRRETMIRRVKIWMAAALVSFVLFTIGSAVALAYNGPWSYDAIVPKFGGDWYSELHTASGTQQKNYTSSVGGGYDGDMWGNIVNAYGSEMASRQPLYDSTWSYYTSGAYAGQSVGFFITSEFWVPVNVEVIGQWYS